MNLSVNYGKSFFSNAWPSETSARQVTWQVIYQHLKSYRKFNSKYLLAHKNNSTLQYFPLKIKSKCRYAKKHSSWKRRWSEVQVCSLSKETLVFLWQRRTRVAKLNVHLLCNFGANSKLWAANWPITGWKQTYLYDKFISVMKF